MPRPSCRELRQTNRVLRNGNKLRHESLLTIVLSFSLILPWSSSAAAYTLQYTDAYGINQIKWPNTPIYISLSSSLSASQPNISPGADVPAALRRALAHWSDVSRVQFVELQSSGQSVSSPTTGGDGVSLITVARTRENSLLFRERDGAQPALTRLFYDESGRISEADIVLNPFQKFSVDGTTGTFDLEATFTHEIGHLLGLDHSSVIGATMQPRQAMNGTFYVPAWSGRTLSADDRAGVQSLYGMPLNSPEQGGITGSITLPGGSPAASVNVWAEDQHNGRVVASAITLSNGLYKLNNIPAGEYTLHAASLSGAVMLSDFGSLQAGYAATREPFIKIRPTEIGNTKVNAGIISVLNSQVETDTGEFMLSLAGLNNRISTVCVPLVPGKTYTLYIGGKHIGSDDVISFSSPFIYIDSESVTEHDFGKGVSVVSVDIYIDPWIHDGDYTVRVHRNDGQSTYLVGALSIETSIIAGYHQLRSDPPGDPITLSDEAVVNIFEPETVDTKYRENDSAWAPDELVFTLSQSSRSRDTW
jgi:hypothetical protein